MPKLKSRTQDLPSPTIPLRSWIVLIAIGILLFLMNLDYTAVNLTLVPIAEEINTDLGVLQWLLSGYVLVWAAFVIPAGRIADLYGKRETLIGGLLLFMLGSGITGLGHSVEVLIAGRIIQGLGAAVFTAPAWASIFTIAPPERQGFVMGVVLSFCGFGLAVGPTLAGFIIEEISWRWIFYVNIPLGVIVIALLMLYARKDTLPLERQKVDLVGTLLLASGLCLSVYAIHKIDVWGFASTELWALIAGGICLITVFVFHDQKQKMRMLPPALFRNKGFMAASLGEFFMAMNFSLVLVMMGLYLQNTLHYSPYETGLIFIAMTISMGILGPIGGKMIDVFGLKWPMTFGALVTGIAVGMLAFLTVESSLPYVVSAMFLVGMGLGVYFTACNVAMMRVVPAEDLNVASGVYTMFMMMGDTISIVLGTSFVVLFGRTHLLENIAKQGMALTPAQHQDLVNIIAKVEHSATQLNDFPSEQVPHLLRSIDEAFAYGLSVNMWFGVLFALIAVALTLWGVKAIPHEKGSSTAHVPMGM